MLSPSELAAVHRSRAGLGTGTGPRIFRAPGRVNLVGEHTDYCDGFCMPAALNFSTCVAISPRSDSRLIIQSLDFDKHASYDLNALPAHGQKNWSDYVAGVAWAMQQRGLPLAGADITITGDVPRNAGLSSSASLEVASALALLSLTSATVSATDIALLCRHAENSFVGAPSGIMDQFISVHGRANHAIALDCRSLTFDYVTLPPHLRLVITNSMVRHSVAGGEYAERRAQVEEGVHILQAAYPAASIKRLRDVTLAQLIAARDQMSDPVFRRCRHIITDSQRVLDGAQLLQQGQIVQFGALLAEAHASYRDDFEASCRECDILVDCALTLAGCYGSRLTGGGFGGCTVSLVEASQAATFRDALVENYARATGTHADSWISEIADGAGKLLVPETA